MQTATPEADAEQLTSTDTLSPKLGESENFSDLPALAGAEHLIHPPPAEGIIAGNQSDVGTTDTDTDTEINKENKESTTENTQNPPREKLPQSHSKDPSSPSGENLTRSLSGDAPSLGEEGAEQLKACTEEAGISDENVNSPEFPGVSYMTIIILVV